MPKSRHRVKKNKKGAAPHSGAGLAASLIASARQEPKETPQDTDEYALVFGESDDGGPIRRKATQEEQESAARARGLLRSVCPNWKG